MLRSDRMWIDPAYRAALDACGLACVGDVLARLDGRVTAWSRSTETLFVPGPAGQPGFYVKRYFYPTWRKRLRGTFRGTFFGAHRSQAECRALQSMRALGIPAVRPVACGARRIGHFVAVCFLITEEVPNACNLTTLAREVNRGTLALPFAARRALVRRLARQVAQMHAAGFAHGQLFWRNVVTRPGPDGVYEFFFLDAQPPRPWRRLSNAEWWQTELAHLAVSAGPFTTRSERLRFLLTYAGAPRLTPQLKLCARAIAELSVRWRHHEARRIRMNDLFELWNRQLSEEPRWGDGVSPAAPTAHAGTQP